MSAPTHQDPTTRGLPALASGRHESRDQGCCLMEYVSILAGYRFSDHPACTPRELTWLAQRTNDAVDDEARVSLALRTPSLVHPPTRRTRTLGPLVLGEIARAGLVIEPDDRGFRRAAEVAGRPASWWRETRDRPRLVRAHGHLLDLLAGHSGPSAIDA